jgi:hypothetical protein
MARKRSGGRLPAYIVCHECGGGQGLRAPATTCDRALCQECRFAVVDWFNDPAVSGADPIETRPGFGALLDRVENNGVRIVLVEDARSCAICRFLRRGRSKSEGLTCRQKTSEAYP